MYKYIYMYLIYFHELRKPYIHKKMYEKLYFKKLFNSWATLMLKLYPVYTNMFISLTLFGCGKGFDKLFTHYMAAVTAPVQLTLTLCCLPLSLSPDASSTIFLLFPFLFTLFEIHFWNRLSRVVGAKKLKADLMAPLALKIYFMMRMLSHSWILKYTQTHTHTHTQTLTLATHRCPVWLILKGTHRLRPRGKTLSKKFRADFFPCAKEGERESERYGSRDTRLGLGCGKWHVSMCLGCQERCGA